MLLAPALGAPPREIAERLGERLSERLGDAVDRVEVAGPGFLNVFLADAVVRRRGAADHGRGRRLGRRGTPEHPEKVNVEFVSANPTGPLTAASGRHAAYGDALARLLTLSGHEVVREYYFNDAGSQVTKLGASVRARARHEPVPEDGYQGDYVAELAARIPDAAETDAETLGVKAAALIMESIRATLAAYRVEFDSYFLEGSPARRRPVADRDRLRACSRRRATRTSPRARCGCARPRTATTRTACCSARPARRRTSPPTSPTTRTRSCAASTA